MEKKPVKLLFCGGSGAGKSLLIRRLLPEQEPVYGFTTAFHTERGAQGLYIQGIRTPPRFTPANRVGMRGPRPGSALGVPQAFNTEGVALLSHIPTGSTVVMDELGYLEQDAQAFLNQVEAVLTGNYRVLAAIKPLEEPHLLRFRALPGVTVLHLTPENRSDVAQRAIALWNGETI